MVCLFSFPHNFLPNGDEFMHKYDSRGVLAPRDIVARAIANEMLKENFQYMYLDATEIDTNTIEKNFPNILIKCNNSRRLLIAKRSKMMKFEIEARVSEKTACSAKITVFEQTL